MVVRFQCKSCQRISAIDLDSSEYYLPTRCPDCGYQYQDSAALRRWLEELRELSQQEHF